MILRSSVETAGTQFKKNRCNVIVLAPTLRIEVSSSRDQLVKAILGEQALSVSVSLDDTPAPRPQLHIFLDNEHAATVADHRVVVVHSPFAEVPLPRSVFSGFPQLVRLDDGNMAWTDRENEGASRHEDA